MRPVCWFLISAVVCLLALTAPGLAQEAGNAGTVFGTQTSGQIFQIFAGITVLAIAPGILIMVTAFPRFIIVFAILRAGIGLQTTPANLILTSLALFMTFYVMSPVIDRAWENGIGPLTREEISEEEAFTATVEPFREFMLRNVRDKDLNLFADLAAERGQEVGTGDNIDMRVLIPAFMISEIRRGFEIGFLVVLPFLVIDLIVATIIMAMGMMMLPPSVVSLPFKILFFVMIDGWNILVGNLVRSVI